MEKPLQPVQLPAIPDYLLQAFRLDTVHGRDLLAEQISKDLDEWAKQAYAEPHRSHLGASIIGHECERFIWFGFRWMFQEIHSGRQQRLFNHGDLEEVRIKRWLQGIGFQIKDVDVDGRQFHIMFADGHGGGSSDGIGQLPTRYGNSFPPILLEYKTQQDKRFNILQGSGVQKEKPMHFIQASVYGRRHNLQYCLYIAINKETNALDVEMIELDWGLADAEMLKAETIIHSYYPPPKLNTNPSFWRCKYCPALAVCHLGAPLPKNCRSCRMAEPVANGQWFCHQYKQEIPTDFIPKGCEQWQPLMK